ncbi:MAG TPA: cytochrome P460 family protein [Pyrinomonadaceae bacterium]|nr:cytochrome P460 family protein [Pyrinomonadaceae bacterium]
MDKKSQIIRICLVAVWLACVFSFMVTASRRSTASSSSKDRKILMVKEVSGYKSWTRVNPVPLLLPTPLDALCRMPTSRDLIETSSNPHRRKYFTVYVNDLGRSAMMNEAKPSFPKNTVIVKEKLIARDSNSPELLTVMVKRGEGFNPASGDWEYMVLNGTGTKIEGSGKLQNCQSCHVLNKSTDYVFRSYLPDDVRSRLR